jgi:SAM-dependent methyltransferase
MFSSDTAYDTFMGRYSRQLARHFADFAGIAGGERVLDVGAGTGALTAELARRGAALAAADPSPQFVATLQRRFPDADVRQASAEALPWEDEEFDASLAQLVVPFMNDAPKGIAEMRRVTKPGGMVAACMWDRDEMEMLAAIRRTQEALDGDREPGAFRTRAELEALFGDGAEVELLSVESDYDDFEEFWQALVHGAGPAGAWAMALDDERRAQAHDELHRQLGEPDGRFTLTGRAWAVRVRRA